MYNNKKKMEGPNATGANAKIQSAGFVLNRK